MIAQTSFAISHDITRYYMNGVYLEQNEGKLVMVATDGRRLSYIAKNPENTLSDFKAVIIPDKILNLIRKLASGEGTIAIAVNDKNAFFSFDNQKLSSSLIEGSFPNYQKVIPAEQTYRISVNRGELSEALKRVSTLVDQKAKRLYVNLSSGTMTLSSEIDIGTAKEEIPCDYEGEEASFALNCQYLSDPLREMTDEAVILEYTEVGKAITLKSAAPRDYFHIIMPMHLE